MADLALENRPPARATPRRPRHPWAALASRACAFKYYKKTILARHKHSPPLASPRAAPITRKADEKASPHGATGERWAEVPVRFRQGSGLNSVHERHAAPCARPRMPD